MNDFNRRLAGMLTLHVMSLSGFIALAQTATVQTDSALDQQATNAPSSAVPAPPRPNTAIIPGLFPGFMKAHKDFVEIAKRGDIDVLFMGDSITDWWRNPGFGPKTNGAIPMGSKAVFEKYFGTMKVTNFGIAGDTTQGVLWRLQNGEGEGYQTVVFSIPLVRRLCYKSI